jgi:hypothetical protein
VTPGTEADRVLLAYMRECVELVIEQDLSILGAALDRMAARIGQTG